MRLGRLDACVPENVLKRWLVERIGKETIGEQIVFIADDRKDDGDSFDGVWALEDCIRL
jgi:hypothetical protein